MSLEWSCDKRKLAGVVSFSTTENCLFRPSLHPCSAEILPILVQSDPNALPLAFFIMAEMIYRDH